jgi:hypothetical protein
MSVYHSPAEAREATLFDVLDTALDKGIVVHGDATISVADVDLVFLGVKLVLASVETMESWRASSRDRGQHPAGAREAHPRPVPDTAVGSALETCAGAADTVSSDLGSDHTSSVPFCSSGPEDATDAGADIEKVEQGLAKLVLTVLELLRRLLEKQAIRRMEGGSLTEAEIERMGRAFQRLAQKVEELKTVFGLTGQELNLDLGPLGNLM